jgi:heme-degrading monooxygenase HmoA
LNNFSIKILSAAVLAAALFLFLPPVAAADADNLGISAGELSDVLRAQLNLDNDSGVIIQSVKSPSPAETAGLKQYDVILKVGLVPVGSVPQFAEALENADGFAVFEILRKKERIQIVIGANGAVVSELPAGRPINADLQAEEEEYEQEIEGITKLQFKRKIPAVVLTREELSKYFKTELENDMNDIDSARASRALARLGLIPAGSDLKEMYHRLFSNAVSGFYDERAHRLYLIEEKADVFAHELTHALQDQYYSLSNRMQSSGLYHEGDLIRRTLLEGEARAVEMEFKLRDSGKHFHESSVNFSLEKTLALKTPDIPGGVPRYLMLRLTIPYILGPSFMKETIRRRGDDWRNISSLFLNPPDSTEQILHPDKFFRNRDLPARIEIANFANQLKGDWELTGADTFGELITAVMLSESVSASEAVKAAAGWDGDALQIYEEKTSKRVVIVWLTVWDSDADAAEFAAAYRKHLEKKLKLSGGTDEEIELAGEKIFRYTLPEGERFNRVERTGCEVAIIENATADELKTAASMLGNSKIITQSESSCAQPTTGIPDAEKPPKDGDNNKPKSGKGWH